MGLIRQLRRHLEATKKLAPDACLECGRPRNGEFEWIYIAGTDPPGSLACSAECLERWLKRVSWGK